MFAKSDKISLSLNEERYVMLSGLPYCLSGIFVAVQLDCSI